MRTAIRFLSAAWLLTMGVEARAQSADLSPKGAIARLNREPGTVPAAEVIRSAAIPIKVEIATDKDTYRAGEVIRLTLKAASAGHARIFYRDAAGDVSTLFPLGGEELARAVRTGAKLEDRVPGGQTVVISGDNSLTGISIVVGGPHFGREEIAVLVTDFAIKEDQQFLAQLSHATTAADAARLTAGLAIRQDIAAKGARAQLNSDGVPTVLTGIGLVSIPLTTKP